MRRLEKGAEPAILVQNGAAWTEAYVAAINDAERKSLERWRHREIHEALKAETGSKCAYCETSVEAGGYMHVEHIVPKSVDRSSAHRWHNLTHACPKCNSGKGNYHDEHLPLLNPYVDDPDQHLNFEGPMVVPEPGNTRAEMSVLTYELNRYPLVLDRFDRLQKLMEAIQRWTTASEPLKTAIARGVREDLRLGEYSAAVETFLKRRGFPVEDSIGADR